MLLCPPDRLDAVPQRFGLRERWMRERVQEIARTFIRGYNAMVLADEPVEVRWTLADVPDYFRPFGYEGAAMGFGAWARVHRRGYADFEDTVHELSPETLYQNYVGLGWWLGVWYARRPAALARIVGLLDDRFRLLPFEGLGFRTGFVRRGEARVCKGFARFGDDACHVCYQGFGRSLWFVYMDDVDDACAVIDALDPGYHGDCYSGLGLGFAYSWLDQAGGLAAVIERVPPPARLDFLQGAAFGWEARQLCDRPLFDRLVARFDAEQREDVHRAVEIVHDAQARLEAEGDRTSFYQQWRRATRDGLLEHGFEDRYAAGPPASSRP